MTNNNVHPVQRAFRTKYSPQFKDQAIEGSEKEGVSQVAKDLGIAESMLYSWRAKKQRFGSSIENQKHQQSEMARLKPESSTRIVSLMH